MHTVNIRDGSASITFTEAELLVLNNSLNEVLNGIEITEFHTRLGVSREDAVDVLDQLTTILDRMKK